MLDEKEKEDIKKRLKELDQKEASYHMKNKPHGSLKAKETINVFVRYTHLGLEFCAIIMFFLFSGKYVDSKLNSAPWIMLLFISIGFMVGMFRVIKAAKDLSNQ